MKKRSFLLAAGVVIRSSSPPPSVGAAACATVRMSAVEKNLRNRFLKCYARPPAGNTPRQGDVFNK